MLNKINQQRHKNSPVAAMRLAILGIASLFLVACGDGGGERWYSQEQANAGQIIYQTQCAACHGEQGESIDNWRQPLANGSYPPPPLDSTAHSWHHSLDALLRQVNDGGIRLGGSMPAFGQQLSKEQQLEVIAAVQAFWPDEIYEKWKQIDANSL